MIKAFSDVKDYISYLTETYIPDLRESGKDATADDLEDIINVLNGKQPKNFDNKEHLIDFLEYTLIPDLRRSKDYETAKDFKTGLRFMKKMEGNMKEDIKKLLADGKSEENIVTELAKVKARQQTSVIINTASESEADAIEGYLEENGYTIDKREGNDLFLPEDSETVDEFILEIKDALGRGNFGNYSIQKLVDAKIKADFDDEVWDKMIEDAEAKEFTRMHSQVLNGGFEQLWSNEKESAGRVEYILDEAHDFVKKYAPNSAEKFAEIITKAMNIIEDAPKMDRETGRYDEEAYNIFMDELDEVDDEYYDFYKSMEKEMEANYGKTEASVKAKQMKYIGSGEIEKDEEMLKNKLKAALKDLSVDDIKRKASDTAYALKEFVVASGIMESETELFDAAEKVLVWLWDSAWQESKNGWKKEKK